MESRLKIVEAKLREQGEKIQLQQDQIHAISMQMARLQALQDALQKQEEKNFESNNEQHRKLFNKMEDLLVAISERRGLFKGMIIKVLGISAVVFILAAASYYFPTVHRMFHHLLEVVQGPFP